MQSHYGHLARLLHFCIDQELTAAVESMELTAAQGRIVGYLMHSQEPPCPRVLKMLAMSWWVWMTKFTSGLRR